MTSTRSAHVYEVRPLKDKRGVDLISDVLPFGRLWYAEPNAVSNAIKYAKFFSRSHDAVIRVYDEEGKAICPVGVIWWPQSSRAHPLHFGRMCHLFPFSHHRHELFFDCGGSFRRSQTKRECFM